jgi:glycine/D-amino acid oxidase-like deaminating enzyme
MVSGESFDAIVVGGGLIGSAGAKYLAQMGLRVALIGPTESQAQESGKVFASHYDISRVQRVIAQDDLWTRLNVESASAWKDLEISTGVSFFQPNGCVYLNDHEDEYLKTVDTLANKFSLNFNHINGRDQLREKLPHVEIGESVFGIFEGASAGLIQPRNLILAQLTAFRNFGGREIQEVVVDLQKVNGVWTATTDSGAQYSSKKVLVSTGAFSNFFNLLPKKLKFQNKSEVVITAELSESDFKKLAGMPSVLFEIRSREFDGIYLTAPLESEDGHKILKMGLNQSLDLNLDRHEEMVQWFQRDSFLEFGPILERELFKLFPTIEFLKTELKPCVISRTATENPYIGEIEDGLFVAHGCNGYSAMSSDAQGRLGAKLLATGKFDQGYKESDFLLVYK